jgi:hypothetical protein
MTMTETEKARLKEWREEKKTVTLTKGEWNSLTTYLHMSCCYREGEKAAWEKLEAEKNDNGTPKFKHAASNARFWGEMIDTLKTVRQKIDGESGRVK